MSSMSWRRGRTSTRAPQQSTVVGGASGFAGAADAVVEDLATIGGFEAVAVARMTDRTWTALAARSDTWSSPVGRPVPVVQSACHHLLGDRWPVLERDLRHHPDPAVRAVAVQHGVSGYAGVALRRPDGRRLGSVCGYSAAPHGGVGADHFVTRLAVAADDLGRRLDAALDAAADERRATYDRALGSADGVTGLPDRRGWGTLLQEEGRRARQLGEGFSVVLVDVGLVRTVRGVRRAGHVLREALPGVGVSRVGGRQFGVVGGGLDHLDPGAVAVAAQESLRAAGYTATSGWAVAEPLEGAVGTWWRSEDALVRARARAAAG